MNRDDTIAAIATAPGEAGISIVRISGPATYAIADAIFRGRGLPPSRRRPFTFAYGSICDGDGRRIDDVLMLFMRAPRSYTGEDQVEIHGHGGAMSCQRILRRALESGARIAGPGEFTQRAFLNGRMDLVQAEAVLDLIKARSERVAKAAVEQLSGSISNSLSTIYDETIAAHADLEATMDFPEDELPDAVMDDILRRLEEVKARTDSLLATWSEGRLLREGALIVIAGRPNVGKSTLLNALLGHSRAIVSDTPGTTRDTIEEGYVLNGIPLRLVDTAGLRDTQCVVEQEGIRRSHDQLRKADVTVYLLDASVGCTAEDEANFAGLEPEKTMVIWNKIDLVAINEQIVDDKVLNDKITKKNRDDSSFSVGRSSIAPRAGNAPGAETPNDASVPQILRLSLRDIQSVALIRDALAKLLHTSYRQGADQQAVISERHRIILAGFRDQILAALELVATRRDDQVPLASAHLRDALEELGTATGRVYHEELLNSIFSRFCIGK